MAGQSRFHSDVLASKGRAPPRRSNNSDWRCPPGLTAGRRCVTQDRDDSWNVVGRLGFTEFFIEERGEAAGIAALEQLTARRFRRRLSRPARRPAAGARWRPRRTEVLAQVCNVNFTALDIGQRPVVMTLMVGVGVLVLPQQQPRRAIYRIWCDPSFGTYLWETLEEVVQKMPGRDQ